MLPPVAAINGARIRELTRDTTIPDTSILQAFRAVVGERTFQVGFCLDLTHRLAKDFDGVIHWGRDTETFQSILKSFIRLDLESVGPPELAEAWEPEITILAANAGRERKAGRESHEWRLSGQLASQRTRTATTETGRTCHCGMSAP